MKKLFIEEGIFTIRVMPLGPNLFLLEDLIFGEVELFIEERRQWWEQWFSSIRALKSSDIDVERLVWVKVLGFPGHAWGLKLFKIISESYGAFIKCDEQTLALFR